MDTFRLTTDSVRRARAEATPAATEREETDREETDRLAERVREVEPRVAPQEPDAAA